MTKLRKGTWIGLMYPPAKDGADLCTPLANRFAHLTITGPSASDQRRFSKDGKKKVCKAKTKGTGTWTVRPAQDIREGDLIRVPMLGDAERYVYRVVLPIRCVDLWLTGNGSEIYSPPDDTPVAVFVRGDAR